MKRRSFLCSSAGLLGSSVLGSKETYAAPTHPRRDRTASIITDCAKRFLAALDSNQRARVAIPFDADERMNWHFIPNNTQIEVDKLGERKGLPMREMAPYQKHLAAALLAAGLSQTGYIKAVTVMSLEDVLRILENDSGERRDPEKYYFCVFGTPSDDGIWGLSRRGSSSQPELHRGRRQRHRRSELLWSQPGRSSPRSSQRATNAGRGGRPRHWNNACPR
jgi:hypothetical protein